MPKEKFILVSLKENESKKLAQVISNDTARKILDYLADKESTESELAEKLQIPMSTVHYNLQALMGGKLVEADEYHYSEKGKEILHYKLANKYIIIAPKSTFGIREKLRSILPAGLVAIAGTFLVYFYNFAQGSFKAAGGNALMAERAADNAVPMAATLAKSAGAEQVATGYSGNIAQPFLSVFLQNPALWFLFGCVFTLMLMIIIEYINYKRQK